MACWQRTRQQHRRLSRKERCLGPSQPSLPLPSALFGSAWSRSDRSGTTFASSRPVNGKQIQTASRRDFSASFYATRAAPGVCTASDKADHARIATTPLVLQGPHGYIPPGAKSPSPQYKSKNGANRSRDSAPFNTNLGGLLFRLAGRSRLSTSQPGFAFYTRNIEHDEPTRATRQRKEK